MRLVDVDNVDGIDDDTAPMRVVPLLLLASLALARKSESQLPESGEELYEIGCAKCHGSDGRGVDPSTVGFSTPVPDFSDCRFASREAPEDWIAVTHEGGPVRGFDSAMPAYGEAFDRERIERIVDFLRGFCTDEAWPRGELNLPRTLVTEKAFPEDEVLWTTFVDLEGSGAFETELVYERRIAARHQWEVALPAAALKAGDSGGWTGGFSDVGLGWKTAFHHTSGRVLAAGGELFVPTGSETKGVGAGTVRFEPYLAFAQLLPRQWFLQAQGGVEIPADSEKAETEAFWRAALGFSVSGARGFGRTWSPMAELFGIADVDSGETSWTLLPQMQVTLSPRQHLRLNVGVALPLGDRDARPVQLVFYGLWDWFDGGLTDGW